ncbi:MAG: FkbM family methyltransferase [Pseudomonadota bacterium]
MIDALKSSVRKVLLRLVLSLTGKGARARVALMDEIRRNRGGSLGVVHQRGQDWLVDGGDHLMWCASGDGLIAAGLAKHGAWQRDDLNHAFATIEGLGIKRRGWFVDVGANIGTHVVYAAHRPEIDRILAIEPEPRNFDFICRNASVNGIENRVTPLQLAVSDQPGKVHLEINEARQGQHIVRDDARDNTIEVAARSLDDILTAHAIDPDDIALLWIDVEWHEHAVFRGMPSVLAAKVPVFFEYARASVPDDKRAAWRENVEALYDHAFVVHPEGARKVSFEEAFDQELADILIC